MVFLTVYAQKDLNDNSVMIYRDKERRKLFVCFDSLNYGKPDKRNKYITLNCYKWKLEWLKDIGK